MATVNVKLAELIEQRGLTQKELADAIGVTQGTISRWVRDQVDSYDKATLIKLLDYFDCELTDIIVVTKTK